MDVDNIYIITKKNRKSLLHTGEGFLFLAIQKNIPTFVIQLLRDTSP